jgi:hypothetical protein
MGSKYCSAGYIIISQPKKPSINDEIKLNTPKVTSQFFDIIRPEICIPLTAIIDSIVPNIPKYSGSVL